MATKKQKTTMRADEFSGVFMGVAHICSAAVDRVERSNREVTARLDAINGQMAELIRLVSIPAAPVPLPLRSESEGTKIQRLIVWEYS